MSPCMRKRNWNVMAFCAVISAALLVSTGGKAYAQRHGFSSGGFGHSGQLSAGFHGSAVGPHWGVQPHGFGYRGGHGGVWSPGPGHDWGYAPYHAGLYSSGQSFYAYPLHAYPLYGYRGHGRRYYWRGYYGGWHSQYYGHH